MHRYECIAPTIRRHQPPQSVVLSLVDCFIHCQVVDSQISLDGVRPRDTGTPWWSFQFSGGEPLGSSWHLHHQPYVQCAQTWKDAVSGLLLQGVRLGSLPSVLWRCLFGIRKGIRPVKYLCDEELLWLSIWSEVHMICIWSSWCHYHPSSLAPVKIQKGSAFLVPAYPGCPGKRPFNGCSSSSSSVHSG